MLMIAQNVKFQIYKLKAVNKFVFVCACMCVCVFICVCVCVVCVCVCVSMLKAVHTKLAKTDGDTVKHMYCDSLFMNQTL